MQRGGSLLTRTGAGRSQQQGAGSQQSVELQFSYLGWWAPHDSQDGDSNRKHNLGNRSVRWQTRSRLVVAAGITWRAHIIYTSTELHPLPPLCGEESAYIWGGQVWNVREASCIYHIFACHFITSPNLLWPQYCPDRFLGGFCHVQKVTIHFPALPST